MIIKGTKKKKKLNKILFFLLIALVVLATSIIILNYYSPETFSLKSLSTNSFSTSSYSFGNLSDVTGDKQWNAIKSSSQEVGLIFWSLNAKDKKTELGWIPKSGSCTGFLDKYIYDENNNQILNDKNKPILLKCETAKCSGQNCYHISLTNAQAVNIDDYIKLGENSFVVVYQDVKKIEYSLDWSNVNVTLYKNVSGTWNNTVNEIWIYDNEDRKKFGANDTSNNNISEYKYIVESTTPIIENGFVPYIKNPEIKKAGEGLDSYFYNENHIFNFLDICFRYFEEYNQSSNCQFTFYESEGHYFLEVTFVSDYFIDPSITVTEGQAVYQGKLTNVTAETGASNHTHLNTSDTAPYDSLVGYWSFDGDKEQTTGTKAYDWNTNGVTSDGTYTGEANATTSGCLSGFGKCSGYDGNGDYVQISTPVGINYSMSAWVKPGFTKVYGGIVTEDGNEGIFTLNSYRFTIYDADGAGVACTTGVKTANQWYHIVVTSNDTNNIIYVNGSRETTCNPTTVGWTMNYIGSDPANEAFDGLIDEVMLFNVSLTAQQVLDIYNNRSERFAEVGLQELNNQTYLNISSGNNKVNVTTKFDNNFQSNLSLFLQYYSGGTWTATSPQNLTNGTNATFTIDSGSTNLTLNYTLIAGPNSTNSPFYTPVVYDGIILDYYSEGGGADTTYPTINITYPSNHTNLSSANFYLNYTYVEANPGFCWYSNNSGMSNSSTTAMGTNFTLKGIEGPNNLTLWCNDTSNNVNYTKNSFRIDTTYPTINASYPINGTNFSTANFYLNYTFVEDYPDFCWYSNNSGVTNSSPNQMPNNFTLKGIEGYNNLTLWCNDTANNVNYSKNSFRIDTTYPTINITNPVNNSYTNSSNFYLNYTFVETYPDFCWYSNNTGVSNSSATAMGNNFTLKGMEGQNNLTLWCNDTANNLNRSIVRFHVDTTKPNVTFNFQNPSDLTTINGVSYGVNVSYNISDETKLNTSEIDFWKKINSTESDNSGIIVNGTETQNGFLSNYEYQSNLTDVWYFWLDDNDFYPATYNLNATFMDNENHVIYSLLGVNDYLKTRLFNVSAFKNYSFFEIMANSSGTKSLRFYYCNSSYSTGSPVSSKSCSNFYNLAPTAAFNHTHSSNSLHQFIPFAINSSGYIGSVYVTSTSYFLTRGQGGAGNEWDVYYITDVTRTDTFQNTTNSGTSWLNISGTPDAHLHQYNGTESLYYYVCANDSVKNENCSSVRSDFLDKGGLPPSAPNVYKPTTGWYSGSITINYTQALSPNGYGLEYNITLVNTTEGFNLTIHNNSLNLSYVWDSTAAKDGEYLIRVSAIDVNGLVSRGFSENISIDNTYPIINITEPFNNSAQTDSTLDINYTFIETYNDTCWYSNDTYATNTTLLSCGVNITTLTWPVGNHNVTIWINDSANNINKSFVNFSISAPVGDTLKPNLTINTPINTTYNTNIIIFNATAIDDTSMTNGKCWSSIDSGATNLTLQNTTAHSDYNATNTTVPDGGYKALFWCNDSSNNVNNSQSINFSVDATYPIINITEPFNNSNSSDTTLDINYTFTEINNNTCWYSNDSYATNTTLLSCGVNVTTLTWPEGYHNVTIWINDSANNINKSFVAFTIDTLAPNVNITYPSNNTNSSDTTLDVNFTRGSDVDTCWYSNDSFAANTTLTSCVNITTVTWTEAKHNVTIWINDSANNINKSQIVFTIDTTNPDIKITTPTNNSFTSDNKTDVNYTRSDVNLDSCWYSNDTYAVNTSLTSCTNITLVNWTEGYHNVSIWANDSANNINKSFVAFTVDITYPIINITEPFNNSDHTDSTLDINYTFIETYNDTCWYSNDTYTVNTTLLSCGVNITTVTWAIGNHNVTIWINDSANNINKSFVNFSISAAPDTTPPYFTTLSNYTHTVNTTFTTTIVANDNIALSTYTLNDTTVFIINRTNGTITNATQLNNITAYWLNISINDTSNNLNSSVFYINVTAAGTGGVTTVATPECRYKKLGYYNLKRVWIKQANCV